MWMDSVTVVLDELLEDMKGQVAEGKVLSMLVLKKQNGGDKLRSDSKANLF